MIFVIGFAVFSVAVVLACLKVGSDTDDDAGYDE